MTTQQIIASIKNPSLLEDIEIQELQKIIEVYPFFSHARLLLTKKMQQSQHLLLQQEIKKTAVSIPNRKAMYEFLYQKEIQETIAESIPLTEVIPVEKQEETPTDSIQKEEPLTKISNSSDPPEEKAEEKKEETVIEESSFTQAVEIEPTAKADSSFSKPIDLKKFGKEDSKEMDFLERQIIGQTIEHVLSQEIAQSKSPISSTEENETEETSDSQKFSDWLTILDHDRLQDWRDQKEESIVKDDMSIIDSFLEKDIKVIPPQSEDIEYSPSNLARLSIVDDEDFVTETLADIYYKQGNIQKALSAYKKLLLKYPEKKTYFAARIEKIEKELK